MDKKQIYVLKLLDGGVQIDTATIHRENKRFYHFSTDKYFCPFQSISKSKLDDGKAHTKSNETFLFATELRDNQFSILLEANIQRLKEKQNSRKYEVRLINDQIKSLGSEIEKLKGMRI